MARMRDCALWLATLTSLLSGEVRAGRNIFGKPQRAPAVSNSVDGEINELFVDTFTESEVKRILADFVGADDGSDRGKTITDLQKELQPLFDALPKDADNRLAYQSSLYALHRFMMSWRGWYIRGLEPSDREGGYNASSLSSDWVPGYIVGSLSVGSGKEGLTLRDLSTAVATLEALVHSEMAKKLGSIYHYLGYSVSEPVEASSVVCAFEAFLYHMLTFPHAQARKVADTFIQPGNSTISARRHSICGNILSSVFGKDRESQLHLWVSQKVDAVRSSGSDTVKFSQAVSVAYAIVDEYQRLQNEDCEGLKHHLTSLEGTSSQPGQVTVNDYHKAKAYKHWTFDESLEILRMNRALDETDQEARIIIPNILISQSNCAEASSLYAICCRNECDTLLAELEQELRASSGAARRISTHIVNSSFGKSRTPKLSVELIDKLEDIESTHDNAVPLYSHAFSAWLHHAFPRDCPRPHAERSSESFPMTASEWLVDVSASWSEDDYVLRSQAPDERQERIADVRSVVLVAVCLACGVSWQWLEKRRIDRPSSSGLLVARLLVMLVGTCGMAILITDLYATLFSTFLLCIFFAGRLSQCISGSAFFSFFTRPDTVETQAEQ